MSKLKIPRRLTMRNRRGRLTSSAGGDRVRAQGAVWFSFCRRSQGGCFASTSCSRPVEKDPPCDSVWGVLVAAMESGMSNATSIADSGCGYQPVRAGRTSSALFWNLLLSIISMLVIFLMQYAILPRALGSRQMGVFSMLWSLSNGLILICQSGLQGALLRYLPELEAKGSYGQMRRLYWGILSTQLAFWALCAAAVVAGRFWGLSVLAVYSSIPLLSALLFVPFRLVLNSQLAVLQAMRDLRWMAIVQIATRVLALALLGVLVGGVFKMDWVRLTAVFAVLGGMDLLGSVLTHGGMARHFRAASTGQAVVSVGRVAWYATPLVARAVMTFIEQGQATPLLLGHLVSEEMAGYYNLAYSLPLRVVEFVPVAIWPIILASFAEAYTRDRRLLAHGLQLYTRLLYVLLLPLAVGGALFGDRVILVFAGEEYWLAFVPCQVFFGLIALHIFSAPLTVCLHVVEKTWLFMVTAALGAATNLALVFALVPRFEDPTAQLLVAVLAVAANWVLVMLIQYGVVRSAVPDFRPPWLALARVALGCMVMLPALALRYALPRLNLLSFIGALAGVGSGRAPFLNTVWQWTSLAVSVLACAALTIVGYRLFGVVDSPTLRIILSSRLPLKHLLARAVASKRVLLEASGSSEPPPAS